MNRKQWYWKMLKGLSLPSKLLILPVLACSLMVAFQTLGEWLIWTNLHLFGKTTEATVVGQDKYYGEDLIAYYLDYRYQVNGTRYVRSSEEVSLLLYTHRGPGDTVTIQYLPLFPPLFPAVSRIEGNTLKRNYLSAGSCWLDVLVFQLALLVFVSARPPTTALAKRRMSTVFTGGCAMLVVTTVAWLAELAVLASLGVYRDVAGLGVGILAGLIAALLAWRPWQTQPD
jgi:hypothetical protein